jgi:hypothetical protein
MQTLVSGFFRLVNEWIRLFKDRDDLFTAKKKPGPDFSGPGFSPMKHKTSEPSERIFGVFLV